MAGTSRMEQGPSFTPPSFLRRLMDATQKGRGLTRLMVATDFSMSFDLTPAGIVIHRMDTVGVRSRWDRADA